MILTEEEARNKFCPLWAVNDRCDIHCVSSDCMIGWRWWDRKYHDGENKDSPIENRRGYCGLGGKPEEE